VKHRGLLSRSALAGLVFASATAVVSVGSAAHAAPSDDARKRPDIRSADLHSQVPGRYIVVLKDKKAAPAKVKAAATALTRESGGNVRSVFTHALKGYSASMTDRQAKHVEAESDVAYVSPVHRFTATDTQANPPSWGLDRIDQVGPKLNQSYQYSGTGAGVTAYVIDSGIDISHADFGGRASYGYNFVGAPSEEGTVANDCDGHGTHVAGTVGGTQYGVAKGVNLVAVRVLDCEGLGTSEDVIQGIDWVTANAAKPAVANMSLGGPKDLAINEAVSRSVAGGVTYAVAAGNESADACDSSPASAAQAIGVGATDNLDVRAWFSNYGKCTTIYAPGVNIVSAAAGTAQGTLTASGTSMASPHVAGAAALLLQADPSLTPKQVRDRLVTGAIAGPVFDTKGSVDRLLNVGTPGPARSAHGLRARSSGKFVSADSAGTKPLVARSASMGGWEKFDIVDGGSGSIALRSKANNKYVTAMSGGTKPLLAQAASVGGWERFDLVNNADGTVSLKSRANNKYVSASTSTTSPLLASATQIGGSWEKFDVEAPAPVFSIRSKASSKIVTAPSAGNNPLVPASTAVGTWEKFELVDANNQLGGVYGLRSLANNKLVTSESNGTKPLRATGTTLGAAQMFDFFDYNTDGTIYLRSWIDDQIVSSAGAGTAPLISSRDYDIESPTYGLGTWERFSLSPA
jgi:subtilisin family serine protease